MHNLSIANALLLPHILAVDWWKNKAGGCRLPRLPGKDSVFVVEVPQSNSCLRSDYFLFKCDNYLQNLKKRYSFSQKAHPSLYVCMRFCIPVPSNEQRLSVLGHFTRELHLRDLNKACPQMLPGEMANFHHEGDPSRVPPESCRYLRAVSICFLRAAGGYW